MRTRSRAVMRTGHHYCIYLGRVRAIGPCVAVLHPIIVVIGCNARAATSTPIPPRGATNTALLAKADFIAAQCPGWQGSCPNEQSRHA